MLITGIPYRIPQNFTPHKSDNSSIGELIFILDQTETTKNGMATKNVKKGSKE